jgi:hypothetical protein
MGKESQEKKALPPEADGSLVDFNEELEVLLPFMVELDMNGVKIFALMEKLGGVDVRNSGISGAAIVSLIKLLYTCHRTFFDIALKEIYELDSY